MNYVGEYVLTRNTSGDVFAGIVESVEWPPMAILPSYYLRGATRLWQWFKHPKGSLSLSAIAIRGGGDSSRIDGPTDRTVTHGVREAHVCTKEAQAWLSKPRNNT